ncbi:hypothetical protein Tco_0959847 [Tanacetum coccineum]
MANSTTEAEYIATSQCCGQVLWIQNQLLDYGYNFMQTKIHVDNESVICVVKNPVYHSKTKHIEIRHHFIRDSYEKRLIEMVKIHTDNNVADLLTKAFDGRLMVYKCSERFMMLFGLNDGNANFHQILDFLTSSSINFALTQIHANIDGKAVVVSKSSVRRDLHLNDEDGSEQPTKPQPTSSTAPQEILTQVATATASQPPKDPNTYRRTKRGRNTKVPQSGGSPKKVGDEDSDNITKTQSTATLNEPHPQGEGLEGHTSGSGEGRMEHQFELTANVLIIPYDSPLPEGYTPGSDEGRLKLQELMIICTKLSKQVLDLEKEKDAQAVEILRLKKRVKRLERQRKSRTSQPRRRKYRQVESSDDDLTGLLQSSNRLETKIKLQRTHATLHLLTLKELL